MRREHGDSVKLLESALPDQVRFTRAGEEEHGEAVAATVDHLYDDKYDFLGTSVIIVIHTPAIAWTTSGPPTTMQHAGFPVR